MGMRPRGTGGRIPKSLTPKQRLARTLRTQQGHATDKKRKGPVEPPDFRSTHAAVNSRGGQIKQAGGFRQFAMRGLRQRKAEWQLVCLTHNLLKLCRAASAESGPPPDRRRNGLGETPVKTARPELPRQAPSELSQTVTAPVRASRTESD